MCIQVNAEQKVSVKTWECELNGTLYCMAPVSLNIRPNVA